MKTEFQKCMDGEIFDGKDKELAEMTLKTKRLLVKVSSINSIYPLVSDSRTL